MAGPLSRRATTITLRTALALANKETSAALAQVSRLQSELDQQRQLSHPKPPVHEHAGNQLSLTSQMTDKRAAPCDQCNKFINLAMIRRQALESQGRVMEEVGRILAERRTVQEGLERAVNERDEIIKELKERLGKAS